MFTKAELQSFRDAAVPDLVGSGCRLLFVGINPGLWTAATQTHFARPGNRFYPALFKAGIIDRRIDPTTGMTEQDRSYLTRRGLGITNIVNRATAQAGELEKEELLLGGERLAANVGRWQPVVVAVAGVTAYRIAFSQPKAVLGPQTEMIAGSELWVVPNPSGLNAHENVDSLAVWYGQVARAAGVI